MNLKKNILIIFTSFAFILNAAALNDTSGDYVYYRDDSFNRESYIGFLYYDEATYRARYYAPAAAGLQEKAVDLLFTVRKNKNGFEMTGERFIIPPLPQDSEIVNYIHDLIYELSGRREKARSASLNPAGFALADYSKNKVDFMEEGERVKCSYPQFGGPVTMLYDSIIPIFNLKKISDNAGKNIFTVAAIGRLTDSSDRAFEEFVPASSVKTERAAKEIPYADKVELSYTAQLNQKQSFTQKAKADRNWTLAMDNVWTNGNAIITFTGFRSKEKISTDEIIRNYLVSGNGSYCDMTKADIHVKGNLIKISAVTYTPAKQNVIIDIKSISKIADNFYGSFGLTTFISDYQKNRGYFDRIIKSYSYKLE